MEITKQDLAALLNTVRQDTLKEIQKQINQIIEKELNK